MTFHYLSRADFGLLAADIKLGEANDLSGYLCWSMSDGRGIAVAYERSASPRLADTLWALGEDQFVLVAGGFAYQVDLLKRDLRRLPLETVEAVWSDESSVYLADHLHIVKQGVDQGWVSARVATDGIRRLSATAEWVFAEGWSASLQDWRPVQLSAIDGVIVSSADPS